MNNNNKKGLLDMWIYAAVVLAISLLVSWVKVAGINISLSVIPVSAGLLSLFFWLFIVQRPIIELYSRGYPYRKLKLWGVILALVFFEFVLVWGLQSKQIQPQGEDLFLTIVIFAGILAFYHSFVRMKVSLRFLLLGAFIPILALGTTLGLSKYFGFLDYRMPEIDISRLVLTNTLYWIVFSLLFQLICGELAFRGFLMQRLLDRGKTQAVLISSAIFALWHIPMSFLGKMGIQDSALALCGNFIMGCLLAMLFIKGKNLLVAAVSHGIIAGLEKSILAAGENPGLSQYFGISSSGGQTGFLILWYGCLLIGALVILLTPQNKQGVVSTPSHLL